MGAEPGEEPLGVGRDAALPGQRLDPAHPSLDEETIGETSGAARDHSARWIGRLLADAGVTVVILPGNHDPVTADSVYVRGGFDKIPGLSVLGMTDDGAIRFAQHELEIWGNAHRDYHDMVPLRDPRPRTTRWQVCAGHGHYEPPETFANPLRPSWLISDEAIEATAADYVALGHWDRPAQVGNGAVPAYYSGSPEWARTVNLVRLTATDGVLVTREMLPAGVV